MTSTPAMAPQEILLPVKPAFIVITLLVALLANLLPWSGWWLWVRPDFVALVLLYWCIEAPRRIGFTAAWLLGLLMDVAEGSLLGQHALSYSIVAYAGIVLHRRVLRFSIAPQVLHVIPLLLLNDVIVLVIRMLAGSGFPGYPYFIGSFVAGALWPVLSVVLKIPQRPRPDPDHA
jgi:rod shape-determining protein MreD